MSDPLSSDGPRQLLADVCALVRDRASAEKTVQAELAAGSKTADAEFAESQRALNKRLQAQKAATEQEWATLSKNTVTEGENKQKILEEEYKTLRAEILSRYAADQKAGHEAMQAARYAAGEAADQARGGLTIPLEDILAGLDSRWKELEKIHQQAVELLSQRGYWDRSPKRLPA